MQHVHPALVAKPVEQSRVFGQSASSFVLTPGDARQSERLERIEFDPVGTAGDQVVGDVAVAATKGFLVAVRPVRRLRALTSTPCSTNSLTRAGK